MFKITLPSEGSSKDFKIELDGEDITGKVNLRKIRIDLEARQPLVATMDVFVDEVEATCFPECMTVNIDHSHCTPEICSERRRTQTELEPVMDRAKEFGEILAAWPEGHLLPDVLRKYVHQRILEMGDRTFADLQRKFGTAVGGNLQVSNPVCAPAAPEAYLPKRMNHGDEQADPNECLKTDPYFGPLEDVEINGVPLEEVAAEKPDSVSALEIVDQVITGTDFASVVDETVRCGAVKEDDRGHRFHPLMTAGED